MLEIYALGSRLGVDLNSTPKHTYILAGACDVTQYLISTKMHRPGILSVCTSGDWP